MDPVYVFGHKNPDTDSIVAAIAYASLRNALGDRQYVACRLGVLSDETSRILQRFGFESPMRLHDVRTQVKDLSFDRPPILSDAVTVHRAWELMNDSELPSASLPIANEAGKLFGMLTSGDIAQYDLRFVEETRLSDVLKKSTRLLAVGDLNELGQVFNVKFKDNAAMLPGVMSRKKQIVPTLSLIWG